MRAHCSAQLFRSRAADRHRKHPRPLTCRVGGGPPADTTQPAAPAIIQADIAATVPARQTWMVWDGHDPVATITLTAYVDVDGLGKPDRDLETLR